MVTELTKDIYKEQERVKQEMAQQGLRVLVCTGTGCIANGSLKVIDKFKTSKKILGVCLGFQCKCQYYGAKIIKDLTGKDVPVLIDPTLLISKNEWEKIKERPVWYKDEKYILTFFLGNMPEKVREYLVNLSNKYKFKIVNLMDKENIDYYCSPPE